MTLSTFRFEPSVIAVRQAEPVRFTLKNTEGVHTFTIAELDLDIILQEGQALDSPIVILARVGEFRLVCRFHELSGMVGTLQVGEGPITPSPTVSFTPTPTAPPSTPSGVSPAGTPIAPLASERETASLVQELAEIENYAASRFYPDRFVIVVGVLVRLYITRLHREHINRFTIEPFVKSTAFFAPGTLGVLEFTPDRTGEFRVRNEGHGYEASLSVVANIGEARARLASMETQEFALVHDFAQSQLAPRKLVVQRGVPVRIYNTGLGGQDKVSIPPFYVSTAPNVQQGKITVIEFTPTTAGEFPISYEQHKLSGTLVVEDRQ
ncbi:MAG: hypothetical protein HYY31_01450 [Chloroflexi bacterium]|nr:hypothetical protein [Chloroflexota bacterium]